jgi:tetratricopeptide (TPR) repeat protein
MTASREIDRLRKAVEGALKGTTESPDLLPLLHRLLRAAPPESEHAAFAHRKLAELLVERDAWRAALHARAATKLVPDDDRGWAALGLSHSMLGNYRSAATAYRQALAQAPENPWYAHNLGHLLDVVLGEVDEAVTWLRLAHQRVRKNSEIGTSYAHALARTGRIEEARRVLARVTREGATREQVALSRWLEGGAPPRSGVHAPVRVHLKEAQPRSRRRGAVSDATRAVEAALDRGLAKLPLDTEQQERARAMARESARERAPIDEIGARSLAAAVSYAIVYEDSLPLSQTEVAATFRVSAARLRTRFVALKPHLRRTRNA